MLGASGSNLAIGISLVLRDQLSGGLASAGNSLNNFQNRAQRAQTEALRNYNAIGAASGVAAMAGMREWVKVGAEFDKQITYMYSISEKKQGYSMDMMKKRAMEVGAETMFSSTQVAEAMVTMAQAGQNVEQVYKNINSVAVLAAATMSDINSSASAMNDIMIGFNIEATEQNSMRVADIITKSINDSNIKLSDFQESMKYIIPTATSLGISLEEVAAVISTIGNAGIKGSMAGTNTENMFRYIARATGAEGGQKQHEALAMLGLQPSDLMNANGQLKSMAEIIPLLGSRLKDMSKNNVQGFNAMMDLLGVRGGRAGNLLAQSMDEYANMLENINNSQGTAMKTSKDVMGSLWGVDERLQSTWETLKITFTDAIEPVLVPLLTMITKFIELLKGMMSTPIGKFLTILGAGFILVRTAIMGYRAVLLSVRLLHSGLGPGFMSSANTVTAGYNQMTAAAQRYNAASMMGGMGGASAMAGKKAFGFFGPTYNSAGRLPGQTFQNARGQWMQVTATGATTFLGKNSMAANMGRFGNFMGKASPYAALGGMALQMGASVVGEETGAGRTMNVAGSALGWAGTGAMLGSVVPGIGTATGAIIGGVGGLLWGLYDDLSREKQKVDSLNPEGEGALPKKSRFNSEEWRLNAQQYLSMPMGSEQWYRGAGGLMNRTDKAGANSWLGNGGMYSDGKKATQITINIDGKKAMDKKVEDSKYESFINLIGM